MAYVKRNLQVNGIEIYFEKKPSSHIIGSLKSDGWHWHNGKRCWYNKHNEYNYYVANRICNEFNGSIDKEEKNVIEAKGKNNINVDDNISIESDKYKLYKKYAYENLSDDKKRDIDFNEGIKTRIKKSDAFMDARPTQKENTLYKHQRAGCLLADKYDKFAFFYDTGTGKTVMALDIINAKYQKDGTRFLIIAPKAIIQTAWVEDARNYYPDMRILPLVNSFKTSKRNKLLAQWKASDKIGKISVQRQDNYLNFLALMTGTEVNYDEEEIEDDRTIDEMAQHFLINAELFIRNPEKYIEEYDIGGIIVDESAVMKNHQSITSETIISVCRKMKYVYLLSGKPAPNHELEYFSQMKAVDPETFWMPYDFFARDFGVNPTYNRVWLSSGAKETLSKLISVRSLIISKDDCLDLPPTTELVYSFELPDKIMSEYDRLYRNCLAVIKGMDESARFYSSTSKLAVLMKLRQMTSGFFIVNNEEGKKKENQIVEIHERKLEELENILDLIGNEQVIIWCQFRYEIQKVEELLSKRGRVVTAYGGTKDINQSIYDFKCGNAQYIIAHPKTLKYGVTFTNCKYAIYYSFSYSAEDYDQSHDRIYRLGQKEKCTFFFLQAENTIDELMYHKVMKKLSDAEFFEWLIKDASEHGINYATLKEQDDDDYGEISDELLENIKAEANHLAKRESLELQLLEVLGSNYEESDTSEKSEAEREINELIELTNVSYSDVSKLHMIIDGILSKCKAAIKESDDIEAIILRHSLDDDCRTERGWEWIGRILGRTRVTARKYYLDGVHFVKRKYDDVLEYLSDVYIGNMSYPMSDEVYDKIFDCLTPEDPTDSEMEELVMPLHESEYFYVSEEKSAFWNVFNKSGQGISVALVDAYVHWRYLYLVFELNGTKLKESLDENYIEEIVLVINGEQKSFILGEKFKVEDQAISYRVVSFELPASMTIYYHDLFDAYIVFSSGVHGYRKKKVHFRAVIGTEGSVSTKKIYPNGCPLDRLMVSDIEMSTSLKWYLRDNGICKFNKLSKLSYSKHKKYYGARKSIIDEIAQILDKYGIELEGYREAIQEEKLAEITRKKEEEERKRVFIEQLSVSENTRIVKLTPFCVIFAIDSYGESFKETLQITHINGISCDGLFETVNISKNVSHQMIRVDIPREISKEWKYGNVVLVQCVINIDEYAYERAISETLTVINPYENLMTDYRISNEINYAEYPLKMSHLATYLVNQELCMLFKIQSEGYFHTSIKWKEIEVADNVFSLSCEKTSIAGNAMRIFYVTIKNPFFEKCTGNAKVKLNIGSVCEEIEVSLNDIYDEKFKLPCSSMEQENLRTYWGIRNPVLTSLGTIVLEKAEKSDDVYLMEFSFNSDTKGGDVNYTVYINGDDVAQGTFSCMKGKKHKFYVMIEIEKLKFLGVYSYKSNCVMEIRLSKWDGVTYTSGITNMMELLWDSKYL